ncbi:hypothetical protein [Ekhidna sp.]
MNLLYFNINSKIFNLRLGVIVLLSLTYSISAFTQGVWTATHSWKTALVNKDTLDYYENADNPGIPNFGDTLYYRSSGIWYLNNNRLYPWFGTRHNSEFPFSVEFTKNQDSISFIYHRDRYTGIIKDDSMVTWSSSDYIDYRTFHKKVLTSTIYPKVHISRLADSTAWIIKHDNREYKLLLHDDSKMTIQISNDSISYSTEGEWKVGELGGHMFLSIYSGHLNSYSQNELRPKGPIHFTDTDGKGYRGAIYLYDSINGPYIEEISIEPSQYKLSKKVIAKIEKRLIGVWSADIKPKNHKSRYRDLFEDNPIHFSLEFKNNMEYEIIQYCDDVKNQAILSKRKESGIWSLGLSGDYILFKKNYSTPGKIVSLKKRKMIFDREISTQVSNHKKYMRLNLTKQ